MSLRILTLLVLMWAIGWRTRRWRLVWLPACVVVGTAGSLAARAYMNDEGLASDPAPPAVWIWLAVFVGGLAVALAGWTSARWWRRVVSVIAVPMAFLCALVALNQWVGYFPTVQTAWNAVTAGPLPDQVDADELPGLRDTVQTTGKLVEVDIPDDASGFKHRSEYVYLPPAWFAGSSPPRLPVLMMIAGEFNTAADWMRSGNAVPVIDEYAQAHNGEAPIFVFVDASGSFNTDTECVDGPRGNAADHLTEDVRPYVVSNYNAAPDPANWGIVGWSMGGTCAVDLVVMHPDLFSTFEDIAGDRRPIAGTEQQTVDRLYGGDIAQWHAYDPVTVMAEHGPYSGVSGWFEDTSAGPGRGGRYGNDPDENGAARDLCAAAVAVDIGCTVHTVASGHTWQFAARAFSDALPWLVSQVHPPSPS